MVSNDDLNFIARKSELLGMQDDSIGTTQGIHDFTVPAGKVWVLLALQLNRTQAALSEVVLSTTGVTNFIFHSFDATKVGNQSERLEGVIVMHGGDLLRFLHHASGSAGNIYSRVLVEETTEY